MIITEKTQLTNADSIESAYLNGDYTVEEIVYFASEVYKTLDYTYNCMCKQENIHLFHEAWKRCVNAMTAISEVMHKHKALEGPFQEKLDKYYWPDL